MPGFIKDVGGQKRMRFTKPGTDPNNLNLPGNDVIFDSNDIGTLSIYRSGEWTSPFFEDDDFGRDVVNGMIVTWPTLPYIPLVVTQYRQYGSFAPPSWTDWANTLYLGQGSIAAIRVRVFNNGIHMLWTRMNSIFPNMIAMRYQVYRFPM